jgi:hypothetical protein
MQTSKSVSLLLAATFAAIAGTAYGAQPPDVGVSGVTTGLAGTALSGGSDAVPKPLATIRHNFRGSARDCGSDGYQFPPGGSYCDKPDTSGAIGPDHFVEMVNSDYAVYTRLGIPVVQISGREFWRRTGVPFGVDEAPLGPSIAFDATEGRWYASAINAASDGLSQGTDLRIAVSRGDDPTEGFIGFKIHLHDLNVANGDSPVMGYNSSGLFLTSFDFDADFNPTGFTLVVLPKSDLLARKPRIDRRTVFQNLSPANAGEYLVPTIDLDGGEQDEIVLATEGNIQYTFGTYKRNDVRGNIFAPHFDVGSGYPNDYFFGRNDFNTFFAAPQPDPNALPLGPNFLTAANTAPVKVNGQIWMATNTVDPGTGRGTIHWLRIDAASTTIIEEGFIADATQSFLFPSIAANQHGDVVIGFNAVGTGPSQFVSSYAVVGKTAGRKTVFGAPILLQHGLASYQLPTDVGTASWGDYSRTTLDPEDDKTFWTIQAIAVDTTHWATQITALHIEH